MAITVVDTAQIALESGEFEDGLTGITIDYPAGLAPGDVVHLAICLPKYRWWGVRGTGFAIARQYGISVPTGWTAAGSRAWSSQYDMPRQGIMWLLRKVATGAEGSDVTIPLTRSNLRPEIEPDNEVLQVATVMVAHRGANLAQPYASPPVFVWGGNASWNSGSLSTSRMVQLGFAVSIDPLGVNPAVDDTMPAWDDPLPTTGQPATWDVLDQASTDAIDTTNTYDHNGVPTSPDATLVVRAAAMDAEVTEPGLSWFGLPPAFSGSNDRWYRVAFALMDASEGISVDTPPPPGLPGVTGSGWLQPEWTGRTHEIATPLVCTIWGPGVDEYGQPALALFLDEDEAPQPVGVDATFNGLGACTSAQVTFAAHPGLVPFEHAVKLGLRLHGGSGEDIVWWAGVVRNVRPDNGAWVVDLDGLWSLLNDARVQLDSSDTITRPTHGVIEGTLVLGVGDPTAVIIENAADEQQSWGTHLNNTFRWTPQAAWGIGPDQVFVMGLPEQGGVETLDADADPAVIAVDQSEFILPPFVTEWWAEASDGSVVSAELTPPLGLLAPGRLAQSRLDDLGNLLMPKEAAYPLRAGPTHSLEYAGIAVPPLRAVNLPSGEDQMVASARVVVTVGEEGNMPTITTTLTTVALPFGGDA